MNTIVLRFPGTRARPPVATYRIVQALVGALLAVDAWLAARRQRAADLQALAQMSDYELRDLGLHRLDTLSSSSLFAAHEHGMR